MCVCVRGRAFEHVSARVVFSSNTTGESVCLQDGTVIL